MKQLLFFIIISISLFSCEEETLTPDNLDGKIERIAKAGIISGASPGIAIGIIKNGQVKTYHFGVQNLNTGEPFNKNTICEIGSITKTMTAYVMADLVLKNKIVLKDSANQYLPASLRVPSRNGKSVTVEHLLNHTSGLATNPGGISTNPSKERQPFNNYDENRLSDYLKGTKLNFDPGEKWVYSNIGLGLAGVIIKQVTGKRVTDLYREKIFQPLGMRSSFSNNAETPANNVAQGYIGKHAFNFFEMGEAFEAAGIVKSNIHDMLLYLDWAMKADDPALRLTKQQTFLIQAGDNPVNGVNYKDLGVGLAWGMLRTENGETIYNHSGGTYGFESFLAFNQNQKTGVILLCNSSFASDLSGKGLAILRLLEK
jgi:CubicO group peptidase (beta-lactamase class C family)